MRTSRIRAVAAFAWLGLALESNARAVDLRDWGRKYATASERFLVLDSPTTFRGAGAGCANLTLSDPISAASVSRNRPALRVSRMTG